jgi:hypothetical protein
MLIKTGLKPADLLPKLSRMWELSAAKITSLEKSCPPGSPSPVFTIKGRYTARGWTERTQGFQYGSAAQQFAATGDRFWLIACRIELGVQGETTVATHRPPHHSPRRRTHNARCTSAAAMVWRQA